MQFPTISVVVVGYKRPKELKLTVQSFLNIVNYPRDKIEMILCDDGSPDEMKEQMRQLDFDKFIFANQNEGIGGNTNKGIRVAKGDFILQLQDDWVFEGNPEFLKIALLAFNEFPRIGMIKFREANTLPCTIDTLSNGTKIKIYKNNRGKSSLAGDYAYTDNPHIKRTDFHKKLGLYKEGAPMHKVELNFCKRCDHQDEFYIAYIDGYEGFKHIGEENSFNPSIKRTILIKRLERVWILKLLLGIYRKIKHRFFIHRVNTFED
jgi:glycosyltransferase involved in cell wall biosynthesis